MQTTRPPHSTADHAPVPGPVDRVSFFEEQRRRRRQTWRFTVLCAAAAALVGVPLAMFITPFLFLTALLTLHLAGLFVPVPAAAWAALRDVSLVVPGFLGGFGDSPEETLLGSLRDGLEATPFLFGSPLLTLALLLVPSMLAVVAVWLAYRSLFRRAGVGGELLALGAREPRPDELEERQLVNLVEEMAIAAGLPPPRVQLLDSPVPNAAAIGGRIDDAVIVVSRGLLERLDRDQTQGVIGHLVGSIGNGDMRIALSIMTLFQTIELFFTVFDALINLSHSAWRDLFRVARCALTGGADARAAAAVAALLDHRLGEWREDGITGLVEDSQRASPRHWTGRVLRRLPFLYVLLLPFGLLYLLFMLLRFQVFLFRSMIVGPLVMLVWRTRRHLADATAVQLTRNPDGLARALVQLAAEGAVMPGGQWFAHLFAVGPEAVQARQDEAYQQRLDGLRQRLGEGSAGNRLGALAEGYRAARQHGAQAGQSTSGTWGGALGGVASHPPLKKRMKRLQKLGAAIAMPSARARVRLSIPLVIWEAASVIVLLPLTAILVYLLACIMAVVFLFGATSAVLFMGLAMPLLYALLG